MDGSTIACKLPGIILPVLTFLCRLSTDQYCSFVICSLLKVNTADGRLRSFIEGLEGEPLVTEFNTLRLVMNIPDILRLGHM